MRALGQVGFGAVVPDPGSTGSAAVAHGLSSHRHVGYSQTKDQTCVSCFGRQFFFTTEPQEAQGLYFFKKPTFNYRIMQCKI